MNPTIQHIWELPAAHQRALHWQKALATHWDVVVVGGGATGLGVALDCALRGYSTLLLEATDYASATSGASTKLIHGGVRYLEKAFKELDPGQFRLVREALAERKGMIARAPHLAHPLGIVLPVYSAFQRFYFGIGLKVYDALAGRGTLVPSCSLSAQGARTHFPLLETQRQKGGILFYDGQFDDAAYANALAQTALAAGATLLNHTRVVGLGPCKPASGRWVGVENRLTGETAEVQARVVVNCTGHFADTLRLMAHPGAVPRIRPSKGIHIALPLPANFPATGMLIPRTDDGRVVFVLPWGGSLLVGTTDTEMPDAATPPHPSRQDVAYLLEQTNRFLAKPIVASELRGTFGGVRPLVAKPGGQKTEALIRDHEVEVSERQGFVSVLGGKWTTYRYMAEDATNAVGALLGKKRKCLTASHNLYGCLPPPPTVGYPATPPHAHLLRYGIDAELIPALGSLAPLMQGHSLSEAELRYVVERQQAVTVTDVLCNRLRTGLENCSLALELGRTLAPQLGALTQQDPQLAAFEHEMQTRLAAIGS